MCAVAAADVRRWMPSDLSDEVARGVEGVYLASFSDEERLPFEDLWSSVVAGGRQLWTAGHDGFAIAVGLDEQADVSLLEYLAVAPARRSSGLGAALLKSVVAALGHVVLEIHDPDGSASPDDHRRLAFYQRNGAGLVACASGYGMPNLTRPGTVPMRLMVIPATDADSLCGEPLRRLITRIFEVSYSRSAQDRDLREVLARLPC